MSNLPSSYLLIILFICSLVCGLIASEIAFNKGLSTGGYFLLGFLLGPIGIIGAAVATPGRTTPKGLVAVHCPRCSARQNVAPNSPGYQCWQCHLNVTRGPYGYTTA